MTLNLKSEEGRAIFFDLCKTADVVIENYRSEVKYRLGIDYAAVSKVNPRIIYGSIAGFGQDGPDAKRPGVDQIAQGMGGLMSITGLPGRGRCVSEFRSPTSPPGFFCFRPYCLR